jgi:hypothetical protein
MRRELVEQVGGWREDRRTIMDWDLFVRLDEAGARFHYEPFVAAGFTRHPGQVTARLAERAAAEADALRADFGVVNPPWRHYLSRARRIGLKTINGAYARELRVRRLRGAPLAGSPEDPHTQAILARVNPGISVPAQVVR